MEFQKVPTGLDIPPQEKVKTLETFSDYQVRYTSAHSGGGCIRKIDKDSYFDIRTGEVSQFKHSDSREDDIKNVQKTLRNLRNTINYNVSDVSRCRWLTLTYAENMRDTQKLKDDFKNFNTRARNTFGRYEYIAIAEPQGRGAWHWHAILIFADTAPFMENSVVYRCWKQGFVKVRKLDNIDNVGAYLSAYLTNMEVDEAKSSGIDFSPSDIKEVESTDDDGNKVSKRVVKGSRLYLYPSGFNIYRCSRGIKIPKFEEVTRQEADRKISENGMILYNSSAYRITDTDSGFRFAVQNERYKKVSACDL